MQTAVKDKFCSMEWCEFTRTRNSESRVGLLPQPKRMDSHWTLHNCFRAFPAPQGSPHQLPGDGLTVLPDFWQNSVLTCPPEALLSLPQECFSPHSPMQSVLWVIFSCNKQHPLERAWLPPLHSYTLGTHIWHAAYLTVWEYSCFPHSAAHSCTYWGPSSC